MPLTTARTVTSIPAQTYRSRVRRLLSAIVAALLVAAAVPACAGVLTRALLAQHFPSPFIVGQRDAELPVWPIFKQNATQEELVAYVFESVDFAPVPGFSGVPVNLLIALDPKGGFMDVRVLSHHEPVFLDGLGEEPLFGFVRQYRGLSLKQNIAIGNAHSSAPKKSANGVRIDGVTKATASVRIINQTVLSSALQVARRKLGYAGAVDPDQVARVRTDLDEKTSVPALFSSGVLAHLVLKNADVEKAFAGSPGAGLDAEALAHPDDIFLELWAAYGSVPSIGHNLLSERAWKRLRARLEDGDHAIVVLARGRYRLLPDEFVPGSVPDRLVLRQNGLPMEMRDLNIELPLAEGQTFRPDAVFALRIISQTGLDPAQPLHFALPVTRLKGMVYPERITREFTFDYTLPERFYTKPQAASKTWAGVWHERRAALAILALGLAVLAAALTWQRSLTADARRFAWFRRAWLLFALFFIGWHAQGQLSIVNLTGLVQALREGRSLSFLLYDPVSLVIWAFVLVSLVAWGRGTFCGWLCPFGALQELTARLGKALHLPQWRIKAAVDARLRLLKYLLFAVIIASALFWPALTDKLVEVEPFKTAITLNFVRHWPFVLYAAGLLLLSAFSYKFFCRYLCPLGAGLALFGRVRLLDWLPRRDACGQPCQTCRHRCDYGAIRRDGTVRYDECFQCMDCVVIYHDDTQCAPLILEKKRYRTIPVAASTSIV